MRSRRPAHGGPRPARSEEHTSELQSLRHLVCRLLLEKKKSDNSETHGLTQEEVRSQLYVDIYDELSVSVKARISGDMSQCADIPAEVATLSAIIDLLL